MSSTFPFPLGSKHLKNSVSSGRFAWYAAALLSMEASDIWLLKSAAGSG